MTVASKADHAYAILSAGLTEGTVLPGHRLVVDRLVREHGISSIPWREALRRLEAEGWVEIIPNTGAVVRPLHRDDRLSSMRIVARLEPLAIALAAPHLGADDLEKARSLDTAARAALADFDVASFSSLERQFHAALRAGCPDARLLAVLDTEARRLEVMDRIAPVHARGRLSATFDEHATLLALIEGGSPAEAIEAAARHHLDRTIVALDADAEG